MYDSYFASGTQPVETLNQCTTIEYALKTDLNPPIFLFLVDVAAEEQELDAIKQNIAIIANSIPKNSLVGIISFGAVVKLHELFEVHDFFRSNAFSGSKKVDIKIIKVFFKYIFVSNKKVKKRNICKI